ncbi:MAG: exodeoxyribonuclease III [Panacagrimonas sp.]
MRIVTLNANGIRSAASKGLFDWLPQQKADVLCLQETKAQLPDLKEAPLYFPKGWTVRLNSAKKKGYAGVAIYSRREPDEVLDSLGVPEFDDEGRYLEFRFGKLSVVSLYLPSGSAGPERQASKDRFLEFFLAVLGLWRQGGREYVVCADWNIAHTELDLKNWKSNQKNSGFLPHERAWMSRVINEQGWIDAHRKLEPKGEGELYTWWSNRGDAWNKNVGWRIDYQLVTPGMAERLRRAKVYKDSRFSDHAPLIVDYAD